ncbi:hypothetical protein [Actinokineospora terrae]|uniref:Tachylectin n=1 Tax=Actinokineospora terrae TaxID=155974 RepID=A0A1H9KT03_9PSEU|nr:hypothetical protein [Actinokineospora terrae]SER02252.1 hypothetical protein SAMN04487818_101311 [Actinokineospora terrae]
MRLRMALAALLTMVASLGLVGSATAAPTEPTYSPTATGAQSFLVVRQNGELVRWDKTSGSYQPQLIGPGWGEDNTRLIASLSTTQLVQIRTDGTLWDWKYTPSAGWNGYRVGGGWSSVTSIAGLATDRFVALTGSYTLEEWKSPSSNHSYESQGIYFSPSPLKLITGLDDATFLSIDTSGGARRWVRGTGSYNSYLITGNWSDVRLAAGVNSTRFVTARTDNRLVEWNLSGASWTSTVYGTGWNDARLLG